MATKKVDPAYSVLRGHVPKELFKRFRIYALEQELDNSEALETLLRERFDPENVIPKEAAVSLKE